ncbi:MAG: hypothetical protein CEN92_461 [Candidatus Berkelbacteria bacterium Licking1014_96]|uniref:SpoVT-AbrB domain-containing protein n=1 Tax=Candidatus Berkelbacteria bacterium Licking1014_96 TaxID=2017149 RepID=A0A554LCB3_9BACT|nr:MAG: hypothetical protein CEN92_461 [Candidatus Berkelbacteria bacterium Licking1014_96]
MKEATRKLARVGKYSFAVTIPREWVTELKWKVKQKVALKLDRGAIRVQKSGKR